MSRDRLLYVDSSSLVKLVLPEPETSAVWRALRDWPERVSSALSRVEVMRAARRAGGRDSALRRAERLLDELDLVQVHDEVIERAAALPPLGIGSLDAIHLATALSLGRALGGFLTHDRKLQEAAEQAGLAVVMAS